MDSKIARGGTELIMISCIIRVSYFKNELTDIFKYLDSKKVFLEKFVYELKELPNFNLVLHKYHKNPSIEQFKEYCIEAHVDFFSIYDRYYDLIFPESEVKIITQDINLKKKILLIGPKGSGKDTFLRSIEVLQFHSQRNLDIPTRILSVIIDNIVIVNTSDFLEGKIGLESAQAIIFMIKNTDEDTTKEVNLLIENFISSYSSQLFGNIPLIIINNVFKGKKPLRAKEIKQYFKLDIVKKKKNPFKYYSLNVIKEDKKIIEPLKWLIIKIFS